MINFSLAHIMKITDSVGILEHCLFATPDKIEGYCTDDNARALQLFLRLEDSRIAVYLQFLLRACTKQGFHQDLNPDLTWKNDDGVTEGFGRAMAALGEAAISALNDDQKLAAIFVFDRQAPLIENANEPRTIAQIITGIFHRIKFETLFPKLVPLLLMRKKLKNNMAVKLPVDFGKELISLAEKLAKYYYTHSAGSWRWYEDILSYDNGRLPLGMFYAYQASGNSKYRDIAIESLDFLIEQTLDSSKSYFSFPGYRGWFPKDGEKALFGQQPIEAGSMVEVCASAYGITKNPKYLHFAKQAFSWYSGNNILGISLIDKINGGIYDGLESWGINPNEGAESILSYAIACLSLKKIQQ